VSVTVEGRTIRVTPDPIVITTADELHWRCATSHRFSVEFDGPGPFASRSLGHDVATSPQRPKTRGRYKYTVALESDPSIQLDPVVVVDPPPTTPEP
jgi:hypothetical protein